MVRSIVRKVLLLGILVLIVAAPCAAQVIPPSSTEDNFHFTVAPYAWLTGISGTVGVRGAQTHIDSSFADLSKYLNFAAMIHADILYREKFGILGEFNYAALGDQASGKRISIDGQMGLILSDIAGYYRIGTFGLGDNGGGKTSLDVLAGARIWNLDMRINTDSRRAYRTLHRETTWVDPIVGARAIIQLTDRWLLDFRGGVGGFGINNGFTWDAAGLVGYTFWEHGTVLLGYRAVGVNHDQGSGKDYFKFDATLHGPIMGVAFTF